MKAKIKLSVGDKTYFPGDRISQKLSPPAERFLLREGYAVKDKDSGKQENSVSATAGSKTVSQSKKQDGEKQEE